jgi:hypothetical protein
MELKGSLTCLQANSSGVWKHKTSEMENFQGGKMKLLNKLLTDISKLDFFLFPFIFN